MTKSKIIFDVFVEEMAQQRVMRQFGLRQLVEPPPTEAPVPTVVHRYGLLIQCSMFDCLSQLSIVKHYLIVQHTP